MGEFSKGMQRRIGLAQALINDPDLVILDEPTSGLDPIGCREVKDLILALARRGKTVILSSHLLADVEDVCDRVVIYYGGKIQAMGTLKELLATPDAIRITTPALPRETMERVLEIIRQDVAEDKVRIDTPTQNLESYFLDVVQKARAGGGRNLRRHFRRARWPPTCAAKRRARPAADKILERLTAAGRPAPGSRAARRAGARGRPSTTGKLAALTQARAGHRACAGAAKPALAAPGRPDLDKANEKLSVAAGQTARP